MPQAFAEEDIWDIITNLASGAKAFIDVGLVHGDIQPSNICVLKNKTLKLIDSSFLTQEKSGAIRKYHQMDYTSPLSPQAMNLLITGPNKGPVPYNEMLNEVWSIGIFLIILQELRYLQALAMTSLIFTMTGIPTQ